MNERLSNRVRKRGTEMGDVLEVVKSISSDGFDVGPEREVGAEDNFQVADLRGYRDGAAIHTDKKISNLPEQWPGGHKHELSLDAVKLEKVGRRPGFNGLKTVDQRLWGERMISVALEIKTIVSHDLAERE